MPRSQLDQTRPICPLCYNASVFPDHEFPYNVQQTFFHEECSTCGPQQDKSLCNFCRHLRITHLFFCDLTSGWHDDFLNQTGINNLNINIRPSPSHSCPFCQLLMSIINREKSRFPGSKGKINEKYYNASLRLNWDPEFHRTRLGLCVGLVFYPILPYENFRGWETIKQPAPSSIESFLKRHDSNPLHVGKKVRWDQVRGWLEECASRHDTCLEKRAGLKDQLKRLPNGFMVIDVKERKIIDGNNGCQFVALSYVWGNKPDDAKLRATKMTIARLQHRHGLSAHELPATVEDAIQICIELGERYLWVDRLCIVQDHHQDKQDQINRMASIYASASLVIVVTEGDMDSGVPGVRHERPIQDIRVVSGSEFSHGLPDILDRTERSRWATRGWTYQEAVLARRKLFFTPSQVYYMCESTTRSESFDRPQGRDSFTQESMKLHPWVGSRMKSWGHHLEAYTARSLRHSSDIYNAFIGICSAVYNENDTLLYGLPRQSFSQALLWCCSTKSAPDAPIHQIRTSFHRIRTPEKDEELPSWSWASVMGKVSMNGSGARDDEFCGSLVEWAVKRSGNSHLVPVRHQNDQEDRSLPLLGFSPQFYLAVAWSQGCLRKPWPYHQLSSFDFLSLDQRIQTQWESAKDFARGCIWGLDEDMNKELQENYWLRDKTLLVSRAQTARFKLRMHCPHSTRPHYSGDPEHYYLDVVDEEGHCIGMLADSEPRVRGEVWPYNEADSFELVALSISRFRSSDFALRCILQSDEELLKDWKYLNYYCHSTDKDKLEKPRGILWKRSRNITFYDRNGVPLDPIPVVNVMLIRRDRRHRHLAHRVSIGWVLLTQWAKAERQFKTIYLE